MGISVEEFAAGLADKYVALFPHLDERARRLVMGADARVLGHGGIRAVARAAGVREATVSLGVDEVDAGGEPLGRVRRVGGGRKKLADTDPGLIPALLALVEPDVRGDPMSPLRWTTKSTRNLAEQLTRAGHRVGADTVGDLLRGEGFSLQGNAKVVEGKQHPDRDGQFGYINEQVKVFQADGDPVVSVDAKKKELIGEFKNGGLTWRPAGDPVKVNTHDFLDRQLGKAIPYGVYDITANTGWVNVGCDHDTAAFAVESIRRWWRAQGRLDYPAAGRLLITADAGGSNGYRTKAWKTGLAALAAETGLAITVCHLPPGTSKWNRIEHRGVLGHHHELARTAPEQPPGHREQHRRDHHRHRIDSPRRMGPRQLPDRNRNHRRADRRATASSTPLPRRLELHPQPSRRAATCSICSICS